MGLPEMVHRLRKVKTIPKIKEKRKKNNSKNTTKNGVAKNVTSKNATSSKNTTKNVPKVNKNISSKNATKNRSKQSQSKKKSNPSNPSNAGMTTPKNDPKEKDADFSASKFFVAAIPDFDKKFSPKRGNESKQQSGQSSGGNLDSLGFNSLGRFSKF